MPIYDEKEPNKSFIDRIRQKRGVDPDVLARPKKEQTAQDKYDDIKALENNQNTINQQLGLGGEKNFASPSGTTNGLQTKQNLFDRAKGLISRNPKKSIGIGATAGLSIGIVTIGLIGLGPLKLMQFANLLQGIHFSDGDIISSRRLRNLVNYSKWVSSSDATGIEDTRLGQVEAFRANKIDAKLAKSGIVPEYDRYGKFTGFEIDQSKMPDSVKKDLKGLNSKNDPDFKKRAAVYSKHFEVDVSPGDIKAGTGKSFKISAPDGSLAQRKMWSRAMKVSPNINKATAAYSKRILYKRANITLNPITRVKQAAKTKFLKKVDDYKQQRQARYAGTDIDLDVPEKRSDVGEDASDSQKNDGDSFDNAHTDAETTVDDIGNGDNPADKKPKLKSKLVGGGGALVALGVLCTAQQMSGDIADSQLDNKLSAMMNVGAEMISIESKIKTGQDLDYETLGLAADSLESTKNAGKTDKDGNLKEGESAVPGSAFDASTLLKWQGKEVKSRTLDNPNVSDANTDSKSLVQQIDKIFGAMGDVPIFGQGMNVACATYNAVDGFMGKVANLLTGGLSDKISAMIMGPIFNGLTGDPVNALADKYKGAAFGEMASMGLLLMQNETNSSMGMDILSAQQRTELNSYIAQEINSEDNRSFIAKNLDLSNPYGLASEAAINVSTIQPSNIIDSPKYVLTNLSSIFSGKGKAQTAYSLTDEDTYGVPKVSIPASLLENPEFENPYKNVLSAKAAIASNPELKEYVQKCRGIEISDDLNFTTKSKDEGGLASYMKKDCKSEPYMAYSLDNQLLNNQPTNNIASLVKKLFGQKAVAAPTAPALTTKQRQYAMVMFAATDTMYAKSYSCLEEDDSESCKEIFPEQKVLDDCGEESTYVPDGDTSDKLYWPIRNQASIQSADSHDFKGVQEGTPVYAVKDGKVEKSEDLTGCDSNGHDGRYCRDGMRSYGRIIKIEHSINGKSPMVYAHLSKRVAQTGDEVKAGQIIGYSGNSGNSSGPHLHIDFSGEYTAVDWLRSQKPELPPKDGAEVSGGTNCPEKEITGSKDYTDDTENPIPKGEQVAEQAKQWAKTAKNCEFGPWGTCKNACLGIVSDLWQSVGKGLVTAHDGNSSDDTAWKAYNYYKDKGWVNKGDKNIPIGAIMWSMDPKDPGQGHAYTYVGDGKIASNDIKVTGQYHIVPADWIETKWNHEFLGWSEWHK